MRKRVKFDERVFEMVLLIPLVNLALMERLLGGYGSVGSVG